MKIDIKLLMRKKDELLAKRQAILDKIAEENRKYTDEERAEDKSLQEQVTDLDEQIRNAQEIEQQRAGIPPNQPKPGIQVGELQPLQDPNIGMGGNEIKQYSLIRAIRAAASGNWRDATLEKEASDAVMKKMGKEPRGFFVPHDWLSADQRNLMAEKREMTIGVLAQGGYLKATDLLAQSFIELLRNKMVVQAAGAWVLTGLVGDIAIPRQTGGATAYWVAEGNAPTEADQAVDQVALAPKTVGAFTDISRKLLLQSSIDVEAFVRNDLATVLALAIDLAALHGSGSGAEPKGLVNQTGVAVVAIAADGGPPTWEHIVSLETEVAADNADIGALAYITNAKVRGKLKQTEKATGTAQFVWESLVQATPLNGYRALVSNQVKSDLTKGSGTGLSAAFFGNWGDLIIGQWGTLDILVDPYTGGTTGTVRVIAFQDVDVAVRHGESFSVILDADTT
jgi:HK97 family phage major capsid protein